MKNIAGKYNSIIAFIFMLLSVPLVAQPELQPLPELSGRVVDSTSTLSAQELSALNAKLNQIEQDSGSQLVVVIVPTTRPESIEAYTIRLAEDWQIGRRGVDDGLILLIAKNDRRLRIEVGYGLEAVIPDATAKQIIDYHIVPHFKQQQFAVGINAGVDAIAARLKGSELPAPIRAQSDFWSFERLFLPILFGFMGLVFGGVGILLARIRNRTLAIVLAVILFLPVLVGLIVAPLAMHSYIIAAICIYVFYGFSLIIFFIGIFAVSTFRGKRGSFKVGSSSINWSTSGSGSFSGSSSSSSSFSGGGGSFGGGGASGSW